MRLALSMTDDRETDNSPIRRRTAASSRRRPGVLLGALAQAGLVALLAPALAFAVPVPLAPAERAAITVEVDDSPAARSIAAGLPASLVFEDRMGAALVAEDVVVAGALASVEPVADYRAGDVVWSLDRRELVVFTHEGAGVGDAALVRVGTVRSGFADLEDCVRDCRLKLSTVESESR
ncbi:cyclophilin-like fold protein [Rathayibacter sp. VKM Ac-2760]|uniref:cyclophilin-like fold protein n=1 Tax=Rathayibacter sp. VKM Ac-2760 TaxID=2609253 RepID=UPI001318DE93|nr:cyclophilin-like fold protein [Rathayibacter sp. VKM Ac-2760]QHC61015.1 hypothetical protein GSU72_20020 [Rathayibacter sp. VKM Ac-2760]